MTVEILIYTSLTLVLQIIYTLFIQPFLIDCFLSLNYIDHHLIAISMGRTVMPLWALPKPGVLGGVSSNLNRKNWRVLSPVLRASVACDSSQ